MGKKKIQSLAPARSLAPRSVPNHAPGPRGGASLVLALGKSPDPGPDHAPSPMTRKEIPSLVPDPSPRGPSPDLALKSGPNPGLDLTAQSLGLDRDLSREETSVPPQDLAARIEKQRKLAVAQSRVQDPNPRQKMGINPNPGPDRTQSLLRKWNRMAENLPQLKTETNKNILSFFEAKINVFFSGSLVTAVILFPTTLSLSINSRINRLKKK